MTLSHTKKKSNCTEPHSHFIIESTMSWTCMLYRDWLNVAIACRVVERNEIVKGSFWHCVHCGVCGASKNSVRPDALNEKTQYVRDGHGVNESGPPCVWWQRAFSSVVASCRHILSRHIASLLLFDVGLTEEDMRRARKQRVTLSQPLDTIESARVFSLSRICYKDQAQVHWTHRSTWDADAFSSVR